MLVVISNPTKIAEEATIINKLFDEGLQVLHLRKPDASFAEIKMLLQEIKMQNYYRISLHQHHEMARDFGINRLHFTEMNRKKTSSEMLLKLKAESYILSTSIHQMQEHNNLSTAIEYTFFGPVFNSISKPGYKALTENNFIFPIEADRLKVIAIGGINAANMLQLKKMKFNGAAVLGSIWQNPNKSILQFKALQKIWKQTGL